MGGIVSSTGFRLHIQARFVRHCRGGVSHRSQGDAKPRVLVNVAHRSRPVRRGVISGKDQAFPLAAAAAAMACCAFICSIWESRIWRFRLVPLFFAYHITNGEAMKMEE